MFPSFWTGPTGKQIKQQGKNAQLLASYLMSSPHCNSIGLYYLPTAYVAHETALSIKEIEAALVSLTEIEFAHYDHDAEFVWVVEMARHQIGESLKESDNRVAGINHEYRELTKNVFLGPFFDRYKDAYFLSEKRVFEGATKSSLNGTKIREEKRSKDKLSQEGESLRGVSENTFEKFYALYPKKKSKGDAEKAWTAIKPDDDLFRKIMASVTRWRSSPDWQKNSGQFIPYPATWLRAKGWEDEGIVFSRPKVGAKPIEHAEVKPSDEDIKKSQEFLKNTITDLSKKVNIR